MTDLPPMVPSAEKRAWSLWQRLAGHWDDDRHRIGVDLVIAHRDGQQSRQPEIDALRAALAEAERALHDIIHGTDGYEEGETAYRLIREAVERGRAALARIREVKRDA